MRGTISKRVALTCLATLFIAACGGKPKPASTETPPAATGADGSSSKAATPTGESPAPQPAILLLDVLGKSVLERPSTPLGTRLRLTVAETGEIFVLDTDHHRILRYAPDGSLRRTVGGIGSGTQQFSSPVDLAQDGLMVWVLDRQNRRLVRLNRDLNYVEEIPLVAQPGETHVPFWYDGVASGTTGDIFLLDKREPQVVRISPSGEVITVYGGFGAGNGRLEAPTDIAAAPDGTLFVADGQRVLRFDRAGNLRARVTWSEKLMWLDVSTETVWVTTERGDILRLQDDKLTSAIVDPRAGRPQPVDLATLRTGAPLVLDGTGTLWQLSGGDSR